MSDYVSNEIQGDLMAEMDLIDWDAWAAEEGAGWDGALDDGAQAG